MKISTIIFILSIFFSGLIAGLFYAWSISVTPGLAKISNESYLQSFQSMNRAILNPVFFIAFFGLVLLLPILCYLTFQSSGSQQFWFVLAATLFYMIGVMAVTVFGNVPLNNSLEVLQIGSMTPEQMNTFRLGFESKWNNLNTLRTVTSSITFMLLLIAGIRNL
jgi:uncharacterized membrane protein